MHDKVLLIDKPAGLTSFGVVARLRRVLSQQAGAKIKVGHTGTLDPFATGLMLVVTGKECKNAGAYTKLDKVYEATFRLGQTSTTADPEGEISDVSARQPSREEINQVLSAFVGTINQTPPIYSAIKVGGQRAYNLARSGQAIDMPARTVHIYSLDVVDYTYPNLRLRAHVGSGTYIRSLAVDIGAALDVGAYCSQLRRTAVGEWNVAQARTLQDFGIDS